MMSKQFCFKERKVCYVFINGAAYGFYEIIYSAAHDFYGTAYGGAFYFHRTTMLPNIVSIKKFGKKPMLNCGEPVKLANTHKLA